MMLAMTKWFYRLYLSAILQAFRIANALGLVSFYEPLPQLRLMADAARTKRAVERWEMIRHELPAKPVSVLDIGCNVGYYSVQLAKLGHFVTALDNKFFAAFVYYAKEALNLERLSSFSMRLDPDNVDSLPRYDCVLFLSVFHHWCREYGADAALKMLDTIYEKTARMLIFETGQTDSASEKYRRALPDMGGDCERWMHDYFAKKGCASVRTLGIVRDRHLVLVTK